MISVFHIALLMGAISLGAQSSDCSPVDGIDSLLQPGEILLLGEIHGTEQAPAFVGRLACLAVMRNLPVIVALEFPVGENARFAEFLESTGDDVAVQRLTESDFWRRDYQDGRASQSTLHLLQSIRSMRAAGGDVRTIAIDDPGSPQGRDEAMASALATSAGQSPDALLVSLTGNLHNRLTAGTRFNSKLVPMGLRVRQLLPDRNIRSLNMAHQGGTAWVCFGSRAADCAVRTLRGSADRHSGIVLFEDGEDHPYSGTYAVGQITASRPAKAELDE